MTGRLRRRTAPWLALAVVLVEVGLVWSGLLDITHAVLIVVALEVLIALTALTRAAAAVRRYRVERAAGHDRWDAALDGLAELLPRPLARLLWIEARMSMCLAHAALSGRARRPAGDFGYGKAFRPLLLGVLAALAIEGALVDWILVAVLGPAGAWVWVALGLHLYAMVWIGGFLASLRLLPHHVGAAALILRDSVFSTLTVPLQAIAAAHVHRTANFGRSGLKLDDRGEGLLAYGDATVEIHLRPDPPVLIDGTPAAAVPCVLRITADDPAGFVQMLADATL